MRELRSGVRRGRSSAVAGKEEAVERNQGSGGMVIRRKRTPRFKRKEPEPPEVDLEAGCFDEIREIAQNVVGDLETEENYNSEDQGNKTLTPYEEASDYLKQSAVTEMALRRTNDEVSAKKRCLEKGLLTQTLLHESSNSYEIDDETREGSVPLAAPECEATNRNYEMYNHKHAGSVPVDIPECETAKDDVVDSNNGKHKKKEKVAPTSKAAPVAEDEMRRTTRLSGKRKASGTVTEQPNVENHLIEAPEEFESDRLHEQQKLIENESQEEKVVRLRVEDQLLNTQNMVSRLEERLSNLIQNGKSPTLISNKHRSVNYGNLGKELASVSTMLSSSNDKDLGVGPESTSTMVPVNNNGNSGKGSALTFTRIPISNKENLGKGPASASNRVHLKNNENSVDSNNCKKKKKEKVAPTSKAVPVAEDEMRSTTRLAGKRKASGTFAEQPNVEDHLREAPEEFESESSMKRNVPGPTTLPHITNTTARHRKVIEYNEHGQPIGQFSSELASYMGVLARKMVPIVHEKWNEVPSTLKEELWRCLEANYVLEATSSKLLINAIGDKWRCFKSNLTSKYILPFKGEPDRRIHPPPKYRFIKQEHWDEFVNSRLNDAFQALHEAQSERRGKNIHPHRLGRTGYARLVEKMIKNEGVTPEEIDSCVLWKKARQNKNGEYADDVTREQAEIIDELKKQADNGSQVCDGNIDVLTLALGTPEHSGRVRGAGNFPSQSIFFRKPKCQALKVADKLHKKRKLIENKWQEERVSRSRVEDQLLNTQNMVSRLEETLANFMQNRKSPTSISNKHPLVNHGNLEKLLASVSTMLPSSNKEDLGVGLASTFTMAPVNDNENLGKGPALTLTSVPISNKEKLRKGPASTSNRVHLNNNKNSGKGPASTSNRVHLNNNENLGKGAASTSNRVHLNNNGNVEKGPASTSNRVHLNNNEYLGNSPASSSDRANSNNYEPSTSGSSQSRVWRNDEENLPVVQMAPSRHVARSVKDSNVSPFQRFYNSASQKLTDSIPFISVPVDAAVFGTDMELYLDLDDVRYMSHMEDLSENCVMAYIRHLYDILMKRGIQHKYEFINPASVSAAKDADLSKIITTRLMNTNCEWVFIPVNPEGAHWLLVVINMVAMSCYWLDPSGLPARYNIKPFVTFGLKGLQKDGVRRSSPIWYNIKCPKQKNSVECGLYVMKFMREIIDEPNIFTRSEPFPKSTYEQDEIDEVRLEWIQTVEAYI